MNTATIAVHHFSDAVRSGSDDVWAGRLITSSTERVRENTDGTRHTMKHKRQPTRSIGKPETNYIRMSVRSAVAGT